MIPDTDITLPEKHQLIQGQPRAVEPQHRSRLEPQGPGQVILRSPDLTITVHENGTRYDLRTYANTHPVNYPRHPKILFPKD